MKNILNKNNLYILTDLKDEVVVLPLKNDLVVFQVFKELKYGELYLDTNSLNKYMKIREITQSEFKEIIKVHFLKGVDGLIYIGEDKPKYIDLTYFSFRDTNIEEFKLINEDYKPMIYALLKSLYELKFVHYLYDKEKLTPDECIIGIVKFLKRTNGQTLYIDLFESYEVGETYCKKKKFIVDKENKEYQLTTIDNEGFYYAIELLLKKDLDNIVRFHLKNKVIKIPAKEFLNILETIGFEQNDFS